MTIYSAHCLRCGQHHYYSAEFLSVGTDVPMPTCGRAPIACENCRKATQVIVGRRFLDWAKSNPQPCIEELVPA